jgi:hypothetical protein
MHFEKTVQFDSCILKQDMATRLNIVADGTTLTYEKQKSMSWDYRMIEEQKPVPS